MARRKSNRSREQRGADSSLVRAPANTPAVTTTDNKASKLGSVLQLVSAPFFPFALGLLKFDFLYAVVCFVLGLGILATGATLNHRS